MYECRINSTTRFRPVGSCPVDAVYRTSLLLHQWTVVMTWCCLDAGVRCRTVVRVQRAAFRRPLHAIPVGRRRALVRRLQPSRSSPRRWLDVTSTTTTTTTATTTTALLPVRQDRRRRGPRTTHRQLRATLLRTSPESRDLGGSHVTERTVSGHGISLCDRTLGLGGLVFRRDDPTWRVPDFF